MKIAINGRGSMKIAIVCSHGGHLTQMLYLMDAFKGNDIIIITYDSKRTQELDYKKYLVKNIGYNPVRMLTAAITFLRVFSRYRPDLIISNGSEIAIPALYIGRLLGAKIIFIESWARVNNPSLTGRLVYPIADHLLVQWPQLISKYGKKAVFEGALI
ncbi:PssD/Cps14F family polysaccharide biosynthesis glycosyltransferase [Methanothrix sp.]|uniref:PssD/Cps14F family polysaccharide biosynthesis glycosyltransferase n=1 Tax=Methanothrix sp. TaxID=90426 RepID=UPI002B6082DD|nr:PssD/Cps14F family polysaccharide biosynthesis glycosyltransferase [Methanothrix sp.]HRW31249.1 PssD/Cps14F family polysaccharide biosynthesis glycosyltransferase [Methanothrix sp.]